MKYFLLLEGSTKLNSRYKSMDGCAYTEPGLREWVQNTFDMMPSATMKEIALELWRHGWLLFEQVEAP